MKMKLLLFAPGIICLGLLTIACRPAAARPPQVASQDPAPPPPAAYSPATPPPDGPPPPPTRRGRRPAPPPPACGPGAPPPPRESANSQAPASTVRATIRQFNYGPEGEISGFVLSNNMQVNLPPEFAQTESIARLKSEVTVAGYPRQTATGKTILDAISVTANGQTIVVPAGPAGPGGAPPPPPPQN